MAQNPLFQLPRRSTRADDSGLVKASANRRKMETIKRTSGNDLRDATVRAKSMSERILGERLEQLHLVTSIEELWKYAKGLAVKKRAALDTETGGLDSMHDLVAGVCLYGPGRKGIYIPTGHISSRTHKRVKGQISKEDMTEVLEYLVRVGVKFIYHNAKFDLKVCYWHYGVDLGTPLWDTGVASNLLNENESHKLKDQHNKYIEGDEDRETARFNTLFEGIQFPLVPFEVGYMYAAYDPIMTYELYLFQRPYLTASNPVCKKRDLTRVAGLFHKIEMPMIRVLFEMENRGVSIDLDYLAVLKHKYKTKLEDAVEEFNEVIEDNREAINKLRIINPDAYGKLSNPINVNSPAQIAILLYDVFKLKSNDRRKPRGTGDDIISDMDHEIVDALKRCRKYSKLISTYLNMDEKVSPTTGRVHANYNQNGPKTGRLSSNDPNMQNIPARGEGAEIRKIFTPREGYSMISSDYSQQEPRSLAELAEDLGMIQAYKDGKDLYMIMASAVYNNKYEENGEFNPDGSKNPEGYKRRNSVKEILLGIIYGRQAKSIAEKLGISKKEAEKLMEMVLTNYPRIGEYMLEQQEKAILEGFVETAGGRKRRLPDMQLEEYEVVYLESRDPENSEYEYEDVPELVTEKYQNLMRRARYYKDKQQIKDSAIEAGYYIIDNTSKIADAERQTLNSVVQGTAADMSKLAMIRVNQDPLMKKLDFHLLIPVHDELIGEAPIENAERASKRLAEIMIECAREIVDIPMKCDAEISERWTGPIVA